MALNLQLTIEGDKAIIEGLNKISKELHPAAMRGLQKSAIGIYGEANKFLSGAGAKGTHREVTSKTGKKYLKWEKRSSPVPSGGYPVPVRTGWLRRSLAWLKSGESKTGEAGTFTAGPHEVVIYNPAAYAHAIHEGLGSSKKFGPRPFLTDAFKKFNEGDQIVKNVENEIRKAIKLGLG